MFSECETPASESPHIPVGSAGRAEGGFSESRDICPVALSFSGEKRGCLGFLFRVMDMF